MARQKSDNCTQNEKKKNITGTGSKHRSSLCTSSWHQKEREIPRNAIYTHARTHARTHTHRWQWSTNERASYSSWNFLCVVLAAAWSIAGIACCSPGEWKLFSLMPLCSSLFRLSLSGLVRLSAGPCWPWLRSRADLSGCFEYMLVFYDGAGGWGHEVFVQTDTGVPAPVV